MTKRLPTRPVKVVGGPHDGLRLRGCARANGEFVLEIPDGAYFPDAAEDYDFDRYALTLALRPEYVVAA